MIVLQNTGITLSVARKVHTEYLKALRFFLQKGRHINMPLFNSTYSISGVFDNDEDSFDPNRHQLNLNLLPGVGIKDVIEQVSVTPSPPFYFLKTSFFRDQ